RKFLLALIDTLPELKYSIDNHPFLPKDYSTEVFLSLNSGIILHRIRKGGVESTDELANYFYQVNNLKTT
ncbi:MAG: TetR/AcrR family transcriptional regulator, partial [Finegoldia magna]|nr:TetR/AcrR family transcriptional regulator [Finegoldia magna]